VVKEEGNYVFKEFVEILNNPNFDLSNVTQINTFLKKLKAKQTYFTVAN